MKLGIIVLLMKRFGKKGEYNAQEVGLGKALAAMGHEVTIYRCVKENEPDETIDVTDGLRMHYVPVTCFGSHAWFPCEVIEPGTEGALCFSDNQIFVPHLYRYCTKKGITFVPYIGTACSLFTGSLHGLIMNILFKIGTLRVYRQIPLIAKTDATKAELMKMGCNQVSVSPVGLDFSVMKQDISSIDQNALKSELGYTPDDFVVLCISRLEPDKRAMELIDIYEQLSDKRNYKLLIIGDGWQKPDMEEEIKRRKLDDKIRIVSHIPYTEMWKYFLACDKFINISRNEIFGMAIMEAIYYMKPVAVSDALGPRVIFKGHMPGHHLCLTDQDLIEHIEMQMPPKKALKVSKERLMNDFSWTHTAEAFCRKVKDSNR